MALLFDAGIKLYIYYICYIFVVVKKYNIVFCTDHHYG